MVKEGQGMLEEYSQFSFEELYFEAESFQNGEETITPFVKFSKTDFNKVFANIVDNAKKHGFKNKTKNFIIRTIISYDASSEQCVLQISNNGLPIDPQFSFDRFIIRGERTSDSPGSGIGGHDINNIVQQQGGTLNWIKDNDNEFTVTIEIRLPLFKDPLYEN